MQTTPTSNLRRKLVSSGLATAFAAPALVSTWARAQDKFPARPINLICPWPAGGSSDGVVRAIGESLGRQLGGTVVVDNKPGAGGTLGAAAMVNAKPDGYALTQLPLGIYRLPHMQKMSFDPVRDITHIACLTGYTFGIVATADAPYKTLREMVAWAKANPGKLTYGHTGIGTTPHLAFEEFADKAGFTTNNVPYKGSAEIMQAILGGHIPLMSGTTEFAPHIATGKLRLLATLGRNRNKAFPDAPTVRESGWETISESPFGIGGPKGMDPALVKTLEVALRKVVDDPKVLEQFDRFFQPIIWMDSAEYSRYAVRTFESEKATIQRLGLARKE
jgi:tripartite-type tricarboxylate transporter receptor subunit TctC